MTIDTESLRANTDIAEVIGKYISLTKSGTEFKALCPFHDDHNPSLTVSPIKHFYHCFACGAHGDVISFIQDYENVDFKTACEKLGAHDFQSATRPTPVPREAPTPEWTPIIPIPHDAPQLLPHPNHTCKIYNPKRSQFTEFTTSRADWYRTAEGKLAGCVLRVDFADGGKFTPTVTFCTNKDGDQQWCIVPFPRPRPLFGLDELAIRTDAPVMVVEGEKAREAAARLFPAYIITCWPGGVNNVAYADWAALKGRDVVIWPDADEAGRRAVLGYETGSNGHATHHTGIAELLAPIATRVRWIDTTGLADGFDAADATFTAKEAIQWAKARIQAIPASIPAPTPQPAPVQPKFTPAPRTNVVPIESARPKALPQSKSGLWEFLSLQTNSNGSPHRDVANICQALQAHPETKAHLWYDEFYGSYFTDWDSPLHEWNDDDDIRLTVWLQTNLDLRKVTDDMVHKAVTRVGHLNARNEPKNWLESIQWDGQSRIQTSFSRYFGAKQTEYSDAVAGNFWISMVARIMEPGCKVDNMVVLEAAQGARKSSALNIIGGKWYCEAHESVMSKDFFLALRGKLVVEIGELDSFSRAENTKVKQVITCRSDRYRAPYGRATTDNPRMNIFVGTTNDDSYLHDSTGARRFWPVRCKAIDTDGLEKDRIQLFAEAVQLYKEGHTWWETPAEQTEAQQEARRTEDVWEESIRYYISGRDEVTMNDVIEAIGLKLQDVQMKDLYRIGHALRAVGWEKKVARRDGRLMKIWIPVKNRG